jgi:tetratricopeptide (TPR) repeat protein
MDYLSLCLICKDENDYLPEWLDYHILMGVDRFYIYDNESRVSLRTSLSDYIERGWVVVVDIPGKAMQLYAYDHCLQIFGAQTFWLGFIDTDEFLVPKTAPGLKELLKDYEQYAGLAVSSLFFGSNGHQSRPLAGQVASYTTRSHDTFKENELLKSIVQPAYTVMPNSPHDFIFVENAWCVNERFDRVDGQRYPNHVQKIQLNHYYSRSNQEIDQKLRRGNSGDIAWARRRFEVVNAVSTVEDQAILRLFTANPGSSVPDPITNLPAHMAQLTRHHCVDPLDIPYPSVAVEFRSTFSQIDQIKSQMRAAQDRHDLAEFRRLLLLRIQAAPNYLVLYVTLSNLCIELDDPQAAWQSLGEAWRRSPNNYVILVGMAFYFLKTDNFPLAENTSRLLLGIAPHDATALAYLTCSFLGLGRYDEAIALGVPLLELDWQFNELPDGMGLFLARQLAACLQQNHDYIGAARLLEQALILQSGDLNLLIALANVLHLAGDEKNARRRLLEARALEPGNQLVTNLLKQLGPSTSTPRAQKERR